MFAFLIMLAQASAGPAYPARGEVRSLFSSDDYPESALLLGQEGTAQARLTVGADGQPTECAIVRSSGHEALDLATCKVLMTRARFRPARDSAGRPMADQIVSPPISWRIEGYEMPVGAWSSRLMVVFNRKDQPTLCSVQFGGALKKHESYIVDCARLKGAVEVPAELARGYAGRQPVIIFDWQFVPQPVASINTPRDLTRFPLINREVARFEIGADGRTSSCRRTKSEGEIGPATEICLATAGQRFRPDRKGARTPIAATATRATYVYVK